VAESFGGSGFPEIWYGRSYSCSSPALSTPVIDTEDGCRGMSHRVIHVEAIIILGACSKPFLQIGSCGGQ